LSHCRRHRGANSAVGEEMRAVESSVSAWATQAQLNGAFGVAAKSTGFHHVERLKRMPTGMPGSPSGGAARPSVGPAVFTGWPRAASWEPPHRGCKRSMSARVRKTVSLLVHDVFCPRPRSNPGRNPRRKKQNTSHCEIRFMILCPTAPNPFRYMAARMPCEGEPCWKP
jgi:hypothetical protein